MDALLSATPLTESQPSAEKQLKISAACCMVGCMGFFCIKGQVAEAPRDNCIFTPGLKSHHAALIFDNVPTMPEDGR
jgi:hypothetical protein